MTADAPGGVPETSTWGRFSCATEHDAGVLTVCVRGEFDLDAVDLFARSLDAALADRPERVMLDLRGLTFIDSSGLTAIMKLRATTLTVLRGPVAVQRVFEYTGLASRLTFIDAPDAGVQGAGLA